MSNYTRTYGADGEIIKNNRGAGVRAMLECMDSDTYDQSNEFFHGAIMEGYSKYMESHDKGVSYIRFSTLVKGFAYAYFYCPNTAEKIFEALDANNNFSYENAMRIVNNLWVFDNEMPKNVPSIMTNLID